MPTANRTSLHYRFAAVRFSNAIPAAAEVGKKTRQAISAKFLWERNFFSVQTATKAIISPQSPIIGNYQVIILAIPMSAGL